MVPPLDGLQVIEGSAFVAAPSGGMTLAQLGADVIRFDQIGGGLDAKRWPLTADGESIYWAGLNKGKRSISVDLRSPRAREILTALVYGAGTFLTNFPARGWMAYETLAAERPDLVMLAVTGNRDGSTALDYTVNCALGYPYATGPVDSDEPVNHVLPAWDLVCGQTAALGILAADRHRLRTGEGSNMSVALSDVAIAAVAAMGHVGEAQVNGTERQRFGNDLYGAFGAEFRTADDERIYAVGISPKQWSSLLEATEATDAVAVIEAAGGYDFRDEGDRFRARADVIAVVSPWIGANPLATVGSRFDELGVCWGRYQTFTQLVDEDPRCSTESEMFREVEQPGIGTYLSPGSPIAFDDRIPVEPAPAPRFGQHTDEILAEELGLSAAEIGTLHDDGIVA
ncbi:MAG: 2-methylfumaryl-CoA isomerase [Acidimicrobiales bacterium]|nr:MAG: 2-methylfumaryl-CoA isomerase [Acidimicrobiales bacterium]